MAFIRTLGQRRFRLDIKESRLLGPILLLVILMVAYAYEPRGWGLQPRNWGKAIIFRAKAKFFGQKPAAKNDKKCIPSSEIKCPKFRIFTNNYWVV